MFPRSQHEVQILSIAAAEHVRLCRARTCHSELLSTSLLSSGSGAFSAGCLGSRFFYLQVRKKPPGLVTRPPSSTSTGMACAAPWLLCLLLRVVAMDDGKNLPWASYARKRLGARSKPRVHLKISISLVNYNRMRLVPKSCASCFYWF